MNKVSLFPVECTQGNCQVPLSPNVVQTKCKHVFHENCITKWRTAQSNCPSCQTTNLNTLAKLFTISVNPLKDCPICLIKLAPEVVLLNCNDGLHKECHDSLYTEKGPLDKCPKEHPIQYGDRKIYTPKEYAVLLSSKTPSPFKYSPPPPKPVETKPAAKEEKTTWLGLSWKMTKAALATVVVYKAGRWLF